MLNNSENNGAEKIGLVTPTPGAHFKTHASPGIRTLESKSS